MAENRNYPLHRLRSRRNDSLVEVIAPFVLLGLAILSGLSAFFVELPELHTIEAIPGIAGMRCKAKRASASVCMYRVSMFFVLGIWLLSSH